MWKCPFNEGDLVRRKDRSNRWGWVTDATYGDPDPQFITADPGEIGVFIKLIRGARRGRVAMGRFLFKGVIVRAQVETFEVINETG